MPCEAAIEKWKWNTVLEVGASVTDWLAPVGRSREGRGETVSADWGAVRKSPVQPGDALTCVLELQSGGQPVPARPQTVEPVPDEPEHRAKEGPSRTVKF